MQARMPSSSAAVTMMIYYCCHRSACIGMLSCMASTIAVSVRNQKGELCLEGTATTYTAALSQG